MSETPDRFADLKGRPKRPHPGRPLSARNRLVFIEDLIASGYGSARTIWRRVAEGDLPKPFKYGVKAAWREASIEKRLDRKQRVS